MINKTFGRWMVLSRGEDYIYQKTGKMAARFICKCECGNTGLVHAAHLKNGSSQSCGCLSSEISTTHGMSRTRAYKSWDNMVRRCDNPGDSEATYKDREITVQDSWRDFTVFFTDMGECPEGFELERKDSFKGYTIDNCTWATETVQATNRARFRNNTSGYTGVTWSESHGKWRVGINVNKIRHEGGLFFNFDSAVEARKLLELKWLGYVKENM